VGAPDAADVQVVAVVMARRMTHMDWSTERGRGRACRQRSHQ
jgi:hypothetical protein